MMTGITLKGAVMFAYRVQEFLLSAGPDWFDTDRFDIVGKVSGGKASETSSTSQQDEIRSMLRRLLEQKFSLRLHRESRVMPLYHLVVAKKGFKLKEGEVIIQDAGAAASGTAIKLVRKATSMSSLSLALSAELHRPVEDHTGITGVYSFTLVYEREVFSPGTPLETMRMPSEVMAQSIRQALQDQLGLSLELIKGPVDVLVVDGAEKPPMN